MTSINNYSGYYQLSNIAAGADGSNVTQPSATDALLQAMSAGDNTNSSNNSDAFLLDLSPQARALLNGSGSSAGGPLTGTDSSFTLTTAQQQQVTAILNKYKDAPYTQDTFNQIQNDLNAAGLGTGILSLEDQVKSFDPSTVLIDALNGTSPDDGSSDGLFGTGTGTSATDEQSKSSNYMQQILAQWQNISTTAPAQNTASTSGAAQDSGDLAQAQSLVSEIAALSGA